MKKLIFYSLIVFSVLVFFFAPDALSQNLITGTIIDETTNKPLQGATIKIEGTKMGALSDRNGKFKIENIKQNQIKAIVSFIGYDNYIIEHDFTKKRKANYTVKLYPNSQMTDEITVTGESQGQVKAMLVQRKAENIKNVVSSQQIEQFPDLNAAEAMQRIPGITLQRDQGEGRYVQLRGTPPELTNFNINGEQIPSPEGDVRYVGMDIISADQIDMIEISKVLTPDMDGDGIGGTVNIITKKAQSEIPKINATMAGGYNNLRGTNNYQLQYSFGQRYSDLGFNLNASYYENVQGSDNMEYKYSKGPFWGSTSEGKDNYHVQYREVQLRHYDITRTRIGLSGTLDYEFDDNSSIYLRGMYNNFKDDEVRYRKIYDLDDALSEEYYLYGGIDHDVKDRVKNQNVSTLNFGGEHEYLGIKVDYEAAYAIAVEDQPDRVEARFDNSGQAIAIKFDRSDPDYPVATYPDSNNAQNAFQYDEYEFDDLLREKSYIEDRNITAKINFTIPYTIGADNDGYVKFGAKTRFKHKERDITAAQYNAYFTTSRIYPGEGPELSLETINGGFVDDNLLNKNYRLEYMPNADLMKDFYNFYSQFFIIDRTGTKVNTYGEDYEAYEDIYAAYAMFKHDYKKLMVLGGFRYEKTAIDYQGVNIKTKRGKFDYMDTLFDKRSHEFFLPQIQFKYSFTPLFNLRAAVTYSYSRPNFEDVLPYREEDRDEVKYGNPDLKFPESMNIDLLAEKYFADAGIISGGLFYKKIDNFIFYYKRFAHEGEDVSDYGLVEIEKAINGIEAFVTGFEFQTQMKLFFLPGILSNFGVYTNYTYTHSKAYINKRYPANDATAVVIFGEDNLDLFSSSEEQEEITLPGQAMHSANVALFYESDKFYTKLSANYHDDFLYQLGADPDLDEYYGQAWHLDFTANYQIIDQLKVFVDVINLTNAPLKFYLGKPAINRIQKQEFYSWWGRIGFKFSM